MRKNITREFLITSFIWGAVFCFLMIFFLSHARADQAYTFIKGNYLVESHSEVVSAGGTTTLTAASNTYETVTGTLNQTIVFPNATLLPEGRRFVVNNQSTGLVTVQASGGGIIATLKPNDGAEFSLLDNALAAGVWGRIGAASSLAWSLSGNSGTDGGTLNFLGTTDGALLSLRGSSASVKSDIFMQTNCIGSAAGCPGDFSLAAGVGSGDLYLGTGNATNANSGSTVYATGNSIGGSSGSVDMHSGLIGSGTLSTSGNVSVSTGDITSGTGSSGNIALLTGAGSVQSGDITLSTTSGAATRGAVIIDSLYTGLLDRQPLRFYETGSSNFIALRAAAAVAADVTFTLPATDGTNTQVMQTNGSGVLSFADITTLAANRSLSNLTSPTAVNQSLVPGTALNLGLGSAALPWGTTHAGSFTTYSAANTSSATFTNAPAAAPSGLSASAGLNTTQAASTFAMYTASGASSGQLRIETGNGATTTSGAITLQSGTANTTSGNINLTVGDGATDGVVNVTSPTVNLLPLSSVATSLKFFNTLATQSIALKAPVLSASTTFVLPATDGSIGYVLQTDGAGNLSFTNNNKTTAFAAYSASTALPSLEPYLVAVCDSASSVTLTLPVCGAGTAGYSYRLKRVNTGDCLIAPNGSDEIDDSNTTYIIPFQYDSIDLVCDGSSDWYIF